MSMPPPSTPAPQQPPQYAGQPFHPGGGQPQQAYAPQPGYVPQQGGAGQHQFGQQEYGQQFGQQPPPPKKKPIYKRVWFWIAVVIGLAILGSIINALGGGGQATPAAPTTAAVAPTEEAAAQPAVEEAAAEEVAVEEPAAVEPPVEEPAAEPAAPDYTLEQQNAIRSAENYLDVMGFSRTGLIDQLQFEDYSEADATLAVDSLNVDWNEQAAVSAQNYIDTMAFSRQGLIDQLVFSGFTPEQAAFGATAVGY